MMESFLATANGARGVGAARDRRRILTAQRGGSWPANDMYAWGPVSDAEAASQSVGDPRFRRRGPDRSVLHAHRPALSEPLALGPRHCPQDIAMTLPTVTELPLKLESVTPDTFIEGARVLTSAERPPVEPQTFPQRLADHRRTPQH